MEKLEGLQGQITFLYYPHIEPAVSFYEGMLGLELVEDQGWAKIFRAGGNAYLGVVAGEKGFHRPQEKNAVREERDGLMAVSNFHNTSGWMKATVWEC